MFLLLEIIQMEAMFANHLYDKQTFMLSTCYFILEDRLAGYIRGMIRVLTIKDE